MRHYGENKYFWTFWDVWPYNYNTIIMVMFIMKKEASVLSESPSPRTIILFGFLFAAILFILCVVSRPESLGHNDGLSYFGAVWWTVIPYTIAFLTYATCCLIASKKIYLTPQVQKRSGFC